MASSERDVLRGFVPRLRRSTSGADGDAIDASWFLGWYTVLCVSCGAGAGDGGSRVRPKVRGTGGLALDLVRDPVLSERGEFDFGDTDREYGLLTPNLDHAPVLLLGESPDHVIPQSGACISCAVNGNGVFVRKYPAAVVWFFAGSVLEGDWIAIGPTPPTFLSLVGETDHQVSGDSHEISEGIENPPVLRPIVDRGERAPGQWPEIERQSSRWGRRGYTDDHWPGWLLDRPRFVREVLAWW